MFARHVRVKGVVRGSFWLQICFSCFSRPPKPRNILLSCTRPLSKTPRFTLPVSTVRFTSSGMRAMRRSHRQQRRVKHLLSYMGFDRQSPPTEHGAAMQPRKTGMTSGTSKNLWVYTTRQQRSSLRAQICFASFGRVRHGDAMRIEKQPTLEGVGKHASHGFVLAHTSSSIATRTMAFSLFSLRTGLF